MGELIINPIGEFPLGDDWAYSKRVSNFLESGSFESPDWGGALFFTQLLWGAAFCKIFGFSFSVLRVSELLALFFTLVIFYQIILKVTASNHSSLIITLLFFLNPIITYQSNTFQPDIPYTLLAILSVYFFLKYTTNNGLRDYIIGLSFASFATLLKQTGISIALTFALCFFLINKVTIRSVIVGIFPVILLISSVVLLMLNNVIDGGDNVQVQLFINSILNPDFETAKKFGFYAINTSLSLGLFISPIVLPAAISFAKSRDFIRHRKILILFFLVYVVLILLKTYLRSRIGLQGGGIEYLPFSGNSIYDLGMGPIVMTGILQNEIPALPKLGEYIWLLISIIGAAGFMSFLYLFVLMIKEHLNGKGNTADYTLIAGIFSVIISVVYLAPILFVYANSKYLTAVIPFTFIASVCSIEFLREKCGVTDLTNYNVAVPLALPLILFGVLATHDYMSLNRTKWDALNYLTEIENIPAEKIDGGFEFNEWHLSHQNILVMTDDSSKKGRFWPVVDDEYIVTVTEIEGYDVYKEFKYRRWLPPGKHSIKVLRRTTRQKNL